jgi:stage V sporulation protein AC
MDIKNAINKEDYKKEVKATMPKSRFLRECILAFVIGGLICVLGQAVSNIGKSWFSLDKEGASAFTAIVMIFLGAFFTGLGVYDVLGRIAGAGSIVPITGFANSIVAPAMEFKREGFILGVGAKLFTIAGPVLVYGISSAILAGILYYIFGGR